MKKSLFILAAALCGSASVAVADTTGSSLFVNFGATAVDGWQQVTQTAGADLSTTVMDSNSASHSLVIDCEGGNITSGNFATITTTWGTGDFDGYSTSLAEMEATIGTTVSDSIWNTGIANGGWKGTSLTIGGFDATKTYNIYLIGGSAKSDLSTSSMYAWELSANNMGENTTIKYDCTGRTGSDLTYLDATGAIKTNQNVANLIKMTNVIVGEDGNITIELNDGERAALNALVIQEVAQVVPEPTTATLSLLALAGLCARRRRK